jgi:hypothetical protein
VLEQIVAEAFRMSGDRNRAWIGRGDDPSLRVRLTLTNLRGAPYSFRLFGSDTDETYGMLNHGDYFDFAVGKAPGLAPDAQPGATPLDVMDLGEKGWDIYRQTALATGAFPVGLAPRIIERLNTSFYGEAQSFGYEDPSTGQYYPVKPDASFDNIAPYSFVSVDGGVIDNAPLELARRYVSGGAAIHNERNGDGANKAVLLIAPFPNFAAAPPKDDNDLLVHVLQQLLSALIDQARFKPEELQLAANDTCFSRFMISPTRQGNGSAIAKQFLSQAASSAALADSWMSRSGGMIICLAGATPRLSCDGISPCRRPMLACLREWRSTAIAGTCATRTTRRRR